MPARALPPVPSPSPSPAQGPRARPAAPRGRPGGAPGLQRPAALLLTALLIAPSPGRAQAPRSDGSQTARGLGSPLAEAAGGTPARSPEGEAPAAADVPPSPAAAEVPPPSAAALAPVLGGPPEPAAPGQAAGAPAMADWPSLAELLVLPAWLNLQLGAVAAPIANPVGGFEPAANWMQQLELNAVLGTGLGRMPADWREIDHWQAQLRLDLYSGSPSFASTIGSLIAPQNMAYPPGLWLSGASLSRRDRSDRWRLTAGLRSLDPDFLVAPVYDAYLFAAINDTLNLNLLGLPITPFAAPALTLRWGGGGLGEWRLGTFWLGPQAEIASLFGVVSGLPDLRGDLQILQWSLAPTPASFDPSGPIRLRGGGSVARQLPPPLLQLGAFRSRITPLTPAPPALLLGGIGLNHVLYGSLTLPSRLPLGLDNRLWGAAQLNLNPAQDGTPLFLAGGWLCQGPLRERPLDVLALGVAYTGFSPQLLPQLSNLIALELNYNFTLNNRLSLQPVLQWIVGPTGRDAVAPILTTALQLSLSF